MTTAPLDYPPAIQAEIDDYCRLLGEELTDGYAFNRAATADAIRHFAWGIGDDNPLWNDEDYGAKTQYGGLVAPPMWIYSCYQAGGLGLPSFTGLHIGTEWTFNHVVKAGEEIRGVHIRTELSSKPVRHAKRALYQATLNRYTNQRGEVVAERLLKELRFLPEDISKEHYMTQPRPGYTDEELRQITEEYSGEARRGSALRYWEDVEVGEEIPMIVKGPFTPRDSIAYYMGIGSRSHVAHKGFWIGLRRTHPDRIIIDPETGLPEERQMHHVKDSMAQARGMPYCFEVGPHRVANMAHAVTNWMGDDGFLKSFNARLRQPTFVGDIYRVHGKVTGKSKVDGEPLVDVELNAVNQGGTLVSPGQAVVRLPSKPSGA